MCIRAVRLEDGTEVACRKCWQCRSNRVNDYVGRCIAEAQTSDYVLPVTLTYAGDVPGAAVLILSDFQKFMKRLRFAGYSVRYIVAGEYGSLRGRAHWHAVLFFKGKHPTVDLERRINWKYWPHGFAWCDAPSPASYKYVLKYMLKDQSQMVSVNKFSLSRNPVLGYDWIMKLADMHAEQGLVPRTFEYSFPDVSFGQKRPVFWLQGKARELFLERFQVSWYSHRSKDIPMTGVYADYADQQVRRSQVVLDADLLYKFGYVVHHDHFTGEWHSIGWHYELSEKCYYVIMDRNGVTQWQNPQNLESIQKHLRRDPQGLVKQQQFLRSIDASLSSPIHLT